MAIHAFVRLLDERPLRISEPEAPHSQAAASLGGVILRGDGGSPVETFYPIAEVRGIIGWSRKRDTYEVTTLDSPRGFREFIAGMRASVFALFMNFTAVTFDDMTQDYEADRSINYRIILADANRTQYDFAALVSDLLFESTTMDRVASNVTFRLTGPVTTS